MSEGEIAAIVLAAGLSRRMGPSNKLLQEIDGQPALRRVVAAICESGLRTIYVITGHQSDAIESTLKGLPVEFVFNENYPDGMGSSIACGAKLIEKSRFTGVALFLGDLAEITPSTIRCVTNVFIDQGQQKIVAPAFHGKRGHPVIFPTPYLRLLRNLSGDSGAKGILSNAGDQLHVIEVSDPSVTKDYDTPEDFKNV